MTATVTWNTIRDPELRVAIEAAVLQALAARPESETWRVRLTETDAVPGWTVVATGPGGRTVASCFVHRNEVDPPVRVEERVRQLLEHLDQD